MTDSGSIVVGWLGKLSATLVLFGLLAFDGFSLVTANFGAADDATTAASAASDDYVAHKNVQSAYDAAVDSLAGKGETVETTTFAVQPNGSVTLTVDRTAKTLWMQHIGPLKKYVKVRQTGTSTPPT